MFDFLQRFLDGFIGFNHSSSTETWQGMSDAVSGLRPASHARCKSRFETATRWSALLRRAATEGPTEAWSRPTSMSHPWTTAAHGTVQRFERWLANTPAGHKVWHTIASGRHSPSHASIDRVVLFTLHFVMPGKGCSGSVVNRGANTSSPPCWKVLGAFAAPVSVERLASWYFIIRGSVLTMRTSWPCAFNARAWSATNVPLAALVGSGYSSETSRMRTAFPLALHPSRAV